MAAKPDIAPASSSTSVCGTPPHRTSEPPGVPAAWILDTIEFMIGETSLGRALVARSGRGICALLLGDDPASLEADLQRRFPGATLRSLPDGAPATSLWKSVSAELEGRNSAGRLALDLCGSDFQREVWTALLRIPHGETATYAEIAHSIGRPGAARAVAGACAANPVAVLVPCHRVVRTDGSLSGYRWGIERKSALLKRESATGGGLRAPTPEAPSF